MKCIETVNITDLNGKDLELQIYVDVYSMIHFEQEYHKLTGKESSFLVELQKIEKTQSMTSIIALLGSAVHLPNKSQPVGVKFLNEKVDVLENIGVLMEALGESMSSNKVKSDNKGK